MTDQEIRATYGDLLGADDADLAGVVRDLACVYPRVEPPAGLLSSVLESEAAAAEAGAVSVRRTGGQVRGRLWGRLSSAHTRPARRPAVLAAAAVLAVAVAGGAVYAMQVLGGSSQTHLTASCAGARMTIAAPAYEVSSPARFETTGGTLIGKAEAQAAHLPHPQYWVVPAGADLVNTCRFVSVTMAEIGTNRRAHTQLQAVSVVPFGQATQPWPVGVLRIPERSDCPVRVGNLSITAPDNRRVAELVRVPRDLSRSVEATFPPCTARRPVRTPTGLPPPSQAVTFRILSQIRYAGSSGTVYVVTAQPSAAALRPGLSLGTSSAGRLPDGSRLFDVGQDIRWLKGRLIISISGNVPVKQLKILAQNVVVR